MLLPTPPPLPLPYPLTLMNSLSWNELNATGQVEMILYLFLPSIPTTRKPATNAVVLVTSCYGHTLRDYISMDLVNFSIFILSYLIISDFEL